MRAFIAEIILPDSWTMTDVVCGINIGLQKHFQTQSLGSADQSYKGDHLLYRKLEDPRGIRTNTAVIAQLPLKE